MWNEQVQTLVLGIVDPAAYCIISWRFGTSLLVVEEFLTTAPPAKEQSEEVVVSMLAPACNKLVFARNQTHLVSLGPGLPLVGNPLMGSPLVGSLPRLGLYSSFNISQFSHLNTSEVHTIPKNQNKLWKIKFVWNLQTLVSKPSVFEDLYSCMVLCSTTPFAQRVRLS